MSFFVKRPPPETGQPEKTAVFPTPALNHEAVYFVKGYASAASTQLSPLLPRNKKAAPHGAAVVNFMNTDFSAIS